MRIEAKICGLSDPPSVEAAVKHGADMVGFVFFPRSPRDIAIDDATMLAARVPERVARVGLFVEPDDDLIARVLAAVPLTMIQLHGKESPARCQDLRGRFGLPIMKALGIAEAGDLEAAKAYEGPADRLLLDAKPPKDSDRPGGNAVAFDWTLPRDGRRPTIPWLLAGGLTPDNVGTAIRRADAPGVDTSSGVESGGPGRKDPEKIRRFLEAVRRAG
ncbi:phosphoribosylanthranilate isomerase [Marivibrio halodurans]|uniref:N-(5'-phosphoribosyl)anthranilate isomerase n=1 Tax=Marivibrio halodurans TaxID=2039722 RepID=A0A8J7V1W9_9PROT|nr:phosphoribosylanthranilate isomerase [Marivibrio halodurans]MBP5858226.1 phosphoribosylanthranilate isomerase [Marivibrio halodurans]